MLKTREIGVNLYFKNYNGQGDQDCGGAGGTRGGDGGDDGLHHGQPFRPLHQLPRRGRGGQLPLG